MNSYLNKWFDVDFNGTIRRAKCVDIEFEGGLGPIFLMRSNRGYTFWLTKKEIKEYEVVRK